MNYAVIKIQGKQHQVTSGQTLIVDKLEAKKGEKITINEVLLLVNEKETQIGQPIIKDTKVTAEIIEQFKGDKIRVAKFKAKSRYRRVTGFRPLLTKIKIIKIG